MVSMDGSGVRRGRSTQVSPILAASGFAFHLAVASLQGGCRAQEAPQAPEDLVVWSQVNSVVVVSRSQFMWIALDVVDRRWGALEVKGIANLPCDVGPNGGIQIRQGEVLLRCSDGEIYRMPWGDAPHSLGKTCAGLQHSWCDGFSTTETRSHSWTLGEGKAGEVPFSYQGAFGEMHCAISGSRDIMIVAVAVGDTVNLGQAIRVAALVHAGGETGLIVLNDTDARSVTLELSGKMPRVRLRCKNAP